jgi:DNA gyrase/topoisomerase IV subunit A
MRPAVSFSCLSSFLPATNKKRERKKKKMKRSEVQGTIEAVLAPLLKRLDDLEGDKAADEKEQQTDQDAHVKEIVEEHARPSDCAHRSTRKDERCLKAGSG